MASHAVIGREHELDEIVAWLDAAPGPRAAVVHGAPGIGKTVLWESAVDRACAARMRVLLHRSVQAEAGFAFAALSDLLGPVFAEVADGLAAPRRKALEVALLLSDAAGAPPEPRAVGLAVVDVLEALAERDPVLLALDDLQWLDTASASVLPAAVRRLPSSRVRLLVTSRRAPAALSAWRDAFSELGALEMALGPLDIGKLQHLLHLRLGLELARPQLERIHRVSGGNPYFALEIARAMTGGNADRIEIPESLSDLLGERLDQLPGTVSETLLHVAALARPTIDLVCAAREHREPALAALEKAKAARVIVLDETRVRFSHPLLASLTYQRAAPWKREAVHRRLADVVTDVEQRARHLALASSDHSTQVAAELDAATAHAAARGAAVVAAELSDLALARTPAEAVQERQRRRLAAARLHWLAGDLERTEALLDQLLADLPAGPERADVLLTVSRTGRTDIPGRARLCEQALADAADDDARATEACEQLAIFRWMSGDVPGALTAARTGLQRARRRRDPRLLAIGAARVAFIESFALQRTPGVLEEGIEAERSLGRPLPIHHGTTLPLAFRHMDLDEPWRALSLLEACAVAAEQEGAAHTLQFALFPLAMVEWTLGRWESAMRHAETAVEFAGQAHDPQYRGIAGFTYAAVAADAGHLDDAREAAREGMAHSHRVGDEIAGLASRAALGRVELIAGDLETAAAHLRDVPERWLRCGHVLGIGHHSWPDTIETLVGLGELDEAGRLLAQYEPLTERANRLARVNAARCRGLLAEARGDTTAALAHLTQAIAADEPATYPFERARVLITLGAVQRHGLQRRAARDSLGRALSIFEEIGARPWEAKARDELRRVSGRGPATAELTEGERRVAVLAAGGSQNKEIAAALFIAVGTVEAHLSRVYRKLGVRSRTELAGRFAHDEGERSNV